MKTTDAITELLSIDEQLAALESQRDSIAALLIRRIGVGESIETEEARLTVVQNTSVTIDFTALVTAAPTWSRKVTKKVLDQAKFTKLRQAEVLPPQVAELLVEKTSDPYLRITKR